MAEIGVGEYVRTTDGKIGKIVKYENFEYHIKIDKDEIWKCAKDYIVKHSKQLIDLIEVGDVIKYKELRSITNNFETNFYENYICDVHNEEELENIINEYNNKKIKILEILTKESYMSNCYKVGGE